VLGGLLAAHQIATDASLALAPAAYTGGLLRLAADLGARLLPALLASPSGVPHPRVHLGLARVPPGARTDSCAAGAGTL
jgi:hypothetical protein